MIMLTTKKVESGQIRTIQDLKAHLLVQNISPEFFAKRSGLSHMTIRRWLRRKPSQIIHAKYYSLLDACLKAGDEAQGPCQAQLGHLSEALSKGEEGFSSVISYLEQTAKEAKSISHIRQEIRSKMAHSKFDQILKQNIKKLWALATNQGVSNRQRLIAVGALLYFLNPLDLVPDTIPGIGYLDDLAVMVIALGIIPEKKNARLAQGAARV